MKKTLFWAGNKHTKRVEIWTNIRYWEEMQGVAMCGIGMTDGNKGNMIGRCVSLRDFIKRANYGGYTILVSDEAKPGKLTIESNGSQAEVSPYIWRSYTGKRFINGIECKGERFMLGTYEVYQGRVAA